MRRDFRLVLGTVLVVGLLALAPGLVRAEVANLGPNSWHTRTYLLTEGDRIEWDWTVISGGDVDFWIEDSEGTKYEVLNDASHDSGQFTVPEDDFWKIQIHNDDLLLSVSVDIEYNMVSHVADDVYNWVLWTIILIIIIVVVIVAIVALVLIKAGKKPPEQQYQRQPPQYPPSQ